MSALMNALAEEGTREDMLATIARLKERNAQLCAALGRALPYVALQNAAEGMLEGFGHRRPRPSDDDLAAVNAALGAQDETDGE